MGHVHYCWSWLSVLERHAASRMEAVESSEVRPIMARASGSYVWYLPRRARFAPWPAHQRDIGQIPQTGAIYSYMSLYTYTCSRAGFKWSRVLKARIFRGMGYMRSTTSSTLRSRSEYTSAHTDRSTTSERDRPCRCERVTDPSISKLLRLRCKVGR